MSNIKPLTGVQLKRPSGDLILERYLTHKASVKAELALCEVSNGDRKLPNCPSSVSEELMAHAFNGFRTPPRVTGDVILPKTENGMEVYYRNNPKLECKAITRSIGGKPGPSSFSPSTGKDAELAIGIMDIDNDVFNVYSAGTIENLAGIQINKNETFGDQQKAGRRPRIVLVTFDDEGNPVWNPNLSVTHVATYFLKEGEPLTFIKNKQDSKIEKFPTPEKKNSDFEASPAS